MIHHSSKHYVAENCVWPWLPRQILFPEISFTRTAFASNIVHLDIDCMKRHVPAMEVLAFSSSSIAAVL